MKKIALAVCVAAVVLVAGFWWLWGEAAQADALGNARLVTLFVAVQAVGTVLTALVIGGAFAQVRQAKRQLEDARRWNQMNFAMTYFVNNPLGDFEDRLEQSFVKIISRDSALSDTDVKKLFEVEEYSSLRLSLKDFLNTIECYCAAINCNLASEEVAKKLYQYKFVAHYRELEPFIIQLRARQRAPGIMCEYEQIYLRWRPAEQVTDARY